MPLRTEVSGNHVLRLSDISILDFPNHTDEKRHEGNLASLPAIPVRDGSFTVEEIVETGGFAIVVATLRIGGHTASGIGCASSETDSAFEIAQENAFKNARTNLGKVLRATTGRSEPRAFASGSGDGPVATSIRDLISHAQLAHIRALEKTTRYSADEEAERMFGCAANELSRAAGEQLIGVLESGSSNSHGIRLAG